MDEKMKKSAAVLGAASLDVAGKVVTAVAPFSPLGPGFYGAGKALTGPSAAVELFRAQRANEFAKILDEALELNCADEGFDALMNAKAQDPVFRETIVTTAQAYRSHIGSTPLPT